MNCISHKHVESNLQIRFNGLLDWVSVSGDDTWINVSFDANIHDTLYDVFIEYLRLALFLKISEIFKRIIIL